MRTDPGFGTRTLFVTAEISGKPDSTAIEIEIEAAGNPVIGANVVLKDLDRKKTATAESESSGLYRTTLEGYARALSLRIVSGDDHLEAKLEGPAPHTIVYPLNDAMLTRQGVDQLLIRWEAEDHAESVEVVPQGSEKVELDGDPHQTRIPLEGLENGLHKVTVTRSNSVELRGGTTGSRMRTRYTVDNHFHLEG